MSPRQKKGRIRNPKRISERSRVAIISTMLVGLADKAKPGEQSTLVANLGPNHRSGLCNM